MTALAARPRGAPVHAGPPVLEARDLTLAYRGERGAHLAVDRVSLSIAQGERLVLLGPSGCGKSTILKAAAGFLKPAGGTIRLRGRPVTGPGPDRIVVFQEFDQLLPWKTALGNVVFPLRRARGLGRAEARARAEEALERVGLARARPVPARAVGRHEAARGDRPRARHAARGAPDGRALRRARRAGRASGSRATCCASSRRRARRSSS